MPTLTQETTLCASSGYVETKHPLHIAAFISQFWPNYSQRNVLSMLSAAYYDSPDCNYMSCCPHGKYRGDYVN